MATLPSLPSGIQLPGSVIDAATSAANTLKAQAEAAVPTFGSLMDAAKSSVSATADAISSGASGLFKDVSSAISSVGAAQFGIGSEFADSAGFEAYKKQIADVQKNAMIDMAVAKAALAQKVKEATAAGQTISSDAINGALAATSSLQNLQANISNPLALAADAAASAAAKASAIEGLKANTLLAMLSKPLPAALAGAVGSSMNSSLVNDLTKFNIIKAQETSATQPVPGQSTPTDTIRPKNFAIKGMLDSRTPPPIVQPTIDRRIFVSEVVAYEAKKDNAKKEYLAYTGLTWNKGDPDFSQADRDTALKGEIAKIYDTQVGRAGANEERLAANAIAKAKSTSERTPEEQAFIDRINAEKEILYAGSWWTKKDELYEKYSNYYDNYKIVYDCWINNGDRFSLPAAVEKELKSG